jgi:hypothetical protein
MTRHDDSLKTIAGHIAQLQDSDPPQGLTASVMRHVQAGKRNRRHTLAWRLRAILAPIPVRIVPVGAAVAMIIGTLIMYGGLIGGKTEMEVLHHHPNIVSKTIVFRLVNPMAREVAVIGTFNHWNPLGYKMERENTDAPWELRLDLSSGEYAYAFLIDGQWVVPDPNSLWQQDDGFGNSNSKLIVANGNHNASDI